MTAALLAQAASNETRRAPASFPIRLRVEDSLRRIASPPQSISAAMIGVCAGSLILHAALLAVTIVTNRVAVMPPHQEIAVDIVQEAPKPPEPAKPLPRLDDAKADTNKTEAAKADAPKAPVAPPAPPKASTANREIAKADPPKPPLAATPQAAQEAAKPQTDAEALRKELAELQAQQAALKSEARALEPSPTAAAGGPLKGSQQALALPSVGGDGDVVGYQEVVFSQLAKAKGMDEYKGDAGTTGVRFEIDDAGKLLSAQVAVSSGKAALDEKALDIVQRAAPFPPPPKDGEHIFFANVNFRPAKRS